MNDLTLSYLAGFVDGEGSISIGQNNHRTSADGPVKRRWYLRLSVHQLDPRPLRQLAEIFGGSVRRHGYKKQKEMRDLFEWVVVSEKAYVAIVALRPYLIVKADQADVGIEFQRLLQNRPYARAVPLTVYEEQQRETLKRHIQELKWQTFYEATAEEEAPFVPKPKEPKLHKTKLPPIRSTQGRVGRPNRGESKMPDPITLEAEYRALGMKGLAAEYGVSKQTVYNWLDKYGIERAGLTDEVRARMSEGLRRSWHAE